MLPVNLPAPPAFMAPVAVPQDRLEDDAYMAIAHWKAAAVEANKNLDRSRTWYEGVRRGYGAKKP